MCIGQSLACKNLKGHTPKGQNLVSQQSPVGWGWVNMNACNFFVSGPKFIFFHTTSDKLWLIPIFVMSIRSRDTRDQSLKIKRPKICMFSRQNNNNNLQCESKKIPPPAVFLNFFPNGWEFLINFYTPIIRPFLHYYKCLFKYLQL